MTDAPERLRVLLVDDEPAVLEGLELQLGRRYEVHMASSGSKALAMIQSMAPFAIVLSDMRMPLMDGAMLLKEVRERLPQSVRMLLTGHADAQSAMAAVNEGGIFRYLTKPCSPPTLLAAFEAAASRYRIMKVEHDLLEHTLRGAVKALAEILGIADPAGYGEALRVQRLVLELAREMRLDPVWPLEVAALLSTIGAVSLPPELQQRLHAGAVLTDEENAVVARMPKTADHLLAAIPRLEPVRAILLLRHALPLPVDWSSLFDGASLAALKRAAAVLRLAAEFDVLERRGFDVKETLGTLRSESSRHDPAVLEAFASLRARDAGRIDVRQLPLARLKPGMVVAADVYTTAGQLLISRGFEISEGLLARMTNFSRGRIREPIAVISRDSGQSAAA